MVLYGDYRGFVRVTGNYIWGFMGMCVAEDYGWGLHTYRGFLLHPATWLHCKSLYRENISGGFMTVGFMIGVFL